MQRVDSGLGRLDTREWGQCKGHGEAPGELSSSSDPLDRLRPGPLTRLSTIEAVDIPSIVTSYADGVPILHASSGIRRIVALAYVLLWSWREHGLAATQLGESETRQVVMLVDELESHLHPRWQRSILGALLKLVKVLHSQATIQLVVATHSPLVLASTEPYFDAEADAWFDLDLVRRGKTAEVKLARRDFVRHGDVSSWLTSEAFDLKEPRSLEAEQAIVSALALARQPKPDKAELKRVEQMLKASLSDIDRFWVRWTEFRSGHGTRAGGAK